MTTEVKHVWKSGDAGALAGPIWVIGWLFTIGYCHLAVVKAFEALVIWPYFLGAALKH